MILEFKKQQRFNDSLSAVKL